MKKILCLGIMVFSLFTSTLLVKADTYGKDEYNYSYWGEPIPSALGLAHRQTYDQYTIESNLEDLPIVFDRPADIYEFNDHLFIVDSGVHALIVLDSEFTVVQYLKELELLQPVDDEGNACVPAPVNEEDNEAEEDDCNTFTTLNGPQGIAVTEDAIYIADTDNGRILQLNREFKVVNEFGTPNDQTFDELEYKPLKVSVDKTGRIYVIAQNVYEGIIELNGDGTFNRFTGVNPISVNIFDVIRRRFATEAQLEQMQLYLPTSFTNMVINESGFIYAVSAPGANGENLNMIKAINPRGIDVLKRTGYAPPQGDIVFNLAANEVLTGPSRLTDVAINNIGMYTVLDQRRGRLFTYDVEGRLLYISADQGVQSGKLTTPVAVTYFGELVVVLDQGTKSIEVFGPTHFGELVNKATDLHVQGFFEESATVWGEVATMNTNYEIAYVGIGKSLLRQQKYKEAMHNFKLGQDKDYYSKAFEGYRKEVIGNNFTLIMTGTSILLIVLLRKPIVEFFKGGKEDKE